MNAFFGNAMSHEQAINLRVTITLIEMIAAISSGISFAGTSAVTAVAAFDSFFLFETLSPAMLLGRIDRASS